MLSHAIIIGIDRYANAGWNLKGAVEDALAFHEWATTAGGVKPENVRLLLSTDDAAHKALATAEATRREIRKVIGEYQRGGGKGTDRLYFFYAGHGVSAPGVTKGGRQEPVLIPADLESLQDDSDLLISFSEIMPCLAGSEPHEQFFFIDACRDFALEEFRAGIGSVGPWIPSPTEGRRPGSQHLLYATSPGQRAYESSIGVFTSVLMEGLQGKGGVEMTYAQAAGTFQVRFPKLATFVIEKVRETVARRIPQNAAKYVQEPQQQSLGSAADPVLVELPENEVPNLPVRVRVSPADALERCRVSAHVHLPRLVKYEYAFEGPPARLPVKFELPPQVYSISATAEGFGEATVPCELYKPSEVELTLAPAPAKPLEVRPPLRIRTRGISRKRQTAAPLAPPTDGLLAVTTDDALAEVVVRDASGDEVLRARGTASLRLAPSLYRVQLVLGGLVRAEELVAVSAGGETRRKLGPPPPRLGQTQLAFLRGLGMVRNDSNYVYTSATNGLADVHLASLLAFAAFARSTADTPELALLRNIGVDVPPASPAILSIVAASGDAPLPDMTPAQFIGQTSLIVFDRDRRVLARHRHEPLPDCAFAAQKVVPMEPGSAGLGLVLPGLEPTHYAVACLPGRVTVFIVVVNDDGTIDAQQYLIPAHDAPPSPWPEETRLHPDNFRRVEIVQRSYSRTAEVPHDAVEDLLWGKWVDPLIGCVAGYALLRHGDRDGFEVAATNMLKHFPGLPDTHVLAAMQWPDDEDRHFAEAARAGIPVFAEGFRALQRWREKTGLEPDTETLEIAEGLLPTSPWTAWIRRGRE